MKGFIKAVLVFAGVMFMMAMCSQTKENNAAEPAKAVHGNAASTKRVDAVKYSEADQAVAMAREYLSHMAFSRKGLREQLEYEGFSSETASRAVKAVYSDENGNCLRCARNYMQHMTFSKAGLRGQLEYEGYSAAAINYAIGEVFR